MFIYSHFFETPKGYPKAKIYIDMYYLEPILNHLVILNHRYLNDSAYTNYITRGIAMQDLVMDKNVITALLSDTRILIIKSLKVRKMMVTELVSIIGIEKNSVCKHLKKLAEAGFIERVKDTKHKWVYYQLTEKGREIILSGYTHFDIII